MFLLCVRPNITVTVTLVDMTPVVVLREIEHLEFVLQVFHFGNKAGSKILAKNWCHFIRLSMFVPNCSDQQVAVVVLQVASNIEWD